jgi:hypothetical protein
MSQFHGGFKHDIGNPIGTSSWGLGPDPDFADAALSAERRRMLRMSLLRTLVTFGAVLMVFTVVCLLTTAWPGH